MIKTILVATDGSSHANKATDLAIDIAHKFQARLVVLHTLLRDARSDTLHKLANRRALTKEQRTILDNYEIDAYQAMSGMDAGTIFIPAPFDILEPIGQQMVDRVSQSAQKAGAKKVVPLLSGIEPAEAILKTAKQEKADMIVMGSRGFGELKGLFLGSVSHKVASHATCPVVTVK